MLLKYHLYIYTKFSLKAFQQLSLSKPSDPLVSLIETLNSLEYNNKTLVQGKYSTGDSLAHSVGGQTVPDSAWQCLTAPDSACVFYAKGLYTKCAFTRSQTVLVLDTLHAGSQSYASHSNSNDSPRAKHFACVETLCVLPVVYPQFTQTDSVRAMRYVSALKQTVPDCPFSTQVDGAF